MTMSKQDARITAHATAIIAQDADLRGDITVGAGCIIQPRATIIAAAAPISLEADCVVAETAVIINRRKEVMRIGKGNHFMVGCRVEAASIGDDNVFKPKSKIASLIRVTDNCSFGAGTVTLPLDPEGAEVETLEPYTVVYGSLCERRTWDGSGSETEKAVREKERGYLREIMPKYNRLRADK